MKQGVMPNLLPKDLTTSLRQQSTCMLQFQVKQDRLT